MAELNLSDETYVTPQALQTVLEPVDSRLTSLESNPSGSTSTSSLEYIGEAPYEYVENDMMTNNYDDFCQSIGAPHNYFCAYKVDFTELTLPEDGKILITTDFLANTDPKCSDIGSNGSYVYTTLSPEFYITIDSVFANSLKKYSNTTDYDTYYKLLKSIYTTEKMINANLTISGGMSVTHYALAFVYCPEQKLGLIYHLNDMSPSASSNSLLGDASNKRSLPASPATFAKAIEFYAEDRSSGVFSPESALGGTVKVYKC